MFCIHLVDDEKNLNEILTMYLQKEGWEVRSFLNGETALQGEGGIVVPPVFFRPQNLSLQTSQVKRYLFQK